MSRSHCRASGSSTDGHNPSFDTPKRRREASLEEAKGPLHQQYLNPHQVPLLHVPISLEPDTSVDHTSLFSIFLTQAFSPKPDISQADQSQGASGNRDTTSDSILPPSSDYHNRTPLQLRPCSNSRVKGPKQQLPAAVWLRRLPLTAEDRLPSLKIIVVDTNVLLRRLALLDNLVSLLCRRMYDESFLIIIPDVVLRKELPRLRSDVRTANKVLPGGTKITSTVGELAAVALQWIWNAMESDYSQFVRIQDVQDVSVSLTRSDDDLILQCLIQILKATPSISRDASFLLTADIDLRRKTLGYGVRANSPGPAASASSFARTLKININGQQPTLSLQALLRVPKAQSQKRKRGDSASFSPQTSVPWHPHGNDVTPCFCKSTITKLSSNEAFGAYIASAIQGFPEVAHHPNVPSIPDEFATELSTCKGLSANSLLEALTPHRVYILSFEFLVTRLEIIKELFRNLCQSAHTPYNILFVLPGMVSGQIDEYKKRGPGCNIWNFDGVHYDAGEVAREVDTWLIHVLEGAGRRWMVCQQEVEDDIPTYQWRQSLDAALKIRDATRRRIAQIRVLYECALKFHRLMKSIRAPEVHILMPAFETWPQPCIGYSLSITWQVCADDMDPNGFLLGEEDGEEEQEANRSKGKGRGKRKKGKGKDKQANA